MFKVIATRILSPDNRDMLADLRFINMSFADRGTNIHFWRILRKFQRSRREPYLPVEPLALAILIRNCSRYYKGNSIQGLLTMVGRIHREIGIKGIRSHPLVKAALRAHFAAHKSSKRVSTYANYKRWLDYVSSDELFDIQARILINHALLANVSCAEISSFRFEHLEITKTKAIWHACGDHGRTIWLDRGTGKYCPVAALEEWIARSGLTEGPLLRVIRVNGTLSKAKANAQYIGKVISAIASHDSELQGMTLHSLQYGGLAEMYYRKLTLKEIQTRTGYGRLETLKKTLRRIVVPMPGCADLHGRARAPGARRRTYR